MVYNRKGADYFFNYKIKFFSSFCGDKSAYLITAPISHLSDDLRFILFWLFDLDLVTIDPTTVTKNRSLHIPDGSSRYQFSKEYPHTIFYSAGLPFTGNPYLLYFNFIYLAKVLENLENLKAEASVVKNPEIEGPILDFRFEVLRIFNFAYFVGAGFNTLISYTDFRSFATIMNNTGITTNTHSFFVLLLLRNVFFTFYANIKLYIR